jgi:hypothetical protein
MIYQKLNKIFTELPTVAKDGLNPHFKSKYATLDGVLELVSEIAKKHNLAISQTINNQELITKIIDLEDKTEITSSMQLLLEKNDMQKLGSAITYARRYSLVTMFSISQEDDDGEATIAKPISNLTERLGK